MRVVIRVLDKGAAFLGQDPFCWLTIEGSGSDASSTRTVSLCEFGGRTYVIEDFPDSIGSHPVRRLADEVGPGGRGTLTRGRTDTDVTLTEVTDPALRQQVVTIAMKDESPGQLDVALSRAVVFEAAPV
jgi:hypothetical protein